MTCNIGRHMGSESGLEGSVNPWFIVFLLINVVTVALLIRYYNLTRVGECYTGNRDPLVKVVETKRYGLFWETQLPTDNPHANTRYYQTYDEFKSEFKRADCFTDEREKK